MKLRGEEVLTYRGMLRYVREGLGRPDLDSKIITNLVKAHDTLYSEKARTLKTIRWNGKLTTFNVYRKSSIDKMIYFARRELEFSSIREITFNTNWHEIKDISDTEISS
jgi:alpha-N-acetylglucosamine transferase